MVEMLDIVLKLVFSAKNSSVRWYCSAVLIHGQTEQQGCLLRFVAKYFAKGVVSVSAVLLNQVLLHLTTVGDPSHETVTI